MVVKLQPNYNLQPVVMVVILLRRITTLQPWEYNLGNPTTDPEPHPR
jgi:hypothetical protein